MICSSRLGCISVLLPEPTACPGLGKSCRFFRSPRLQYVSSAVTGVEPSAFRPSRNPSSIRKTADTTRPPICSINFSAAAENRGQPVRNWPARGFLPDQLAWQAIGFKPLMQRLRRVIIAVAVTDERPVAYAWAATLVRHVPLPLSTSTPTPPARTIKMLQITRATANKITRMWRNLCSPTSRIAKGAGLWFCASALMRRLFINWGTPFVCQTCTATSLC